MSQNPDPNRKTVVNTEDQNRAVNPSGTGRDTTPPAGQQPAIPASRTPGEDPIPPGRDRVEGDDIRVDDDRSPNL